MLRRLFLLIALSMALSAPAQAKGDQPVIHVVYPGHTLGKIAKRYNVSVDAICTANGIRPNAKIKPQQKLVIPTRSDKDGSGARKLVEQGKFRDKGIGGASSDPKSERRTTADDAGTKKAERPADDSSWRKYVKPARRKGYVVLHATGRRWSGYAIVKGNKVSTQARAAFRRVLYSWRTGEEHDVDPRLIRLLTEVSDKFGGRPIKIASGYRENSFARESKHKLGRACDFSIEGMPNEALYAYLSTLKGVGVGYYPNSSFVHLDVRPKTTHWTDYSEPGEAPRKRPRGAAGPSSTEAADAGAGTAE